ncbi:MAG TPA: Mov34/MPN/PAD-1 family protein, partial [Tepidisphaeraceae bacterium]|nr:Mov34/MPN/PAD-1 family protein [Tepidisphaeraceae bacterium]
ADDAPTAPAATAAETGLGSAPSITPTDQPPTSPAEPAPVATAAPEPAPAPADPAPAIPTPAPRDIANVRPEDHPRLNLPPNTPGRLDRFQVLVRQSVLNQIHRHGLAAQDIKICGVLVGDVYHDARGPYAYVEYAIEGNHATGRSTQVTFTADTWTHIQTIMERDHGNRRILGWYHTHPGFGIFLSEMDVFICTNFFPEPWQIALVYDPKAAEEGIFVWRNDRPEPDPFLVEPDDKPEQLTQIVNKAKDTSSQAMPSGDLSALTTRLDAIEKRQRTLLTVLLLTLLIAIAWPLAAVVWLPELLKGDRPSVPASTTPAPLTDPTKRPSLLD